MNRSRRHGSRVIAALLLLAILQFGLQIGFAEPVDTVNAIVVPPAVVARLKTLNNQPILVNGLSATTGASILTGATIETGADQSATVTLGPLGSLDVAQNTKLVLTYDDQGNVKVLLIYGCAVLTAKKKTNGEIATEQGTAAKNDSAVGGVLNVCFQQGATAPTVNTGLLGSIPQSTGGGRGLFGLGTVATLAIFGGIGGAALTAVLLQDNPSGSTP